MHQIKNFNKYIIYANYREKSATAMKVEAFVSANLAAH